MLVRIYVDLDLAVRTNAGRSIEFDDYFMVMPFGDWAWLPLASLNEHLKREKRQAIVFTSSHKNEMTSLDRILTFHFSHDIILSENLSRDILEKIKLGYRGMMLQTELHNLSHNVLLISLPY